MTENKQDCVCFIRRNGLAFQLIRLHGISINYTKDAGIDSASSHSGRRTFITNLANKGINIGVLMQLAGHRNISTTQRYIDCNDGMLMAAVERI